jgi:hypothetical protein
VICRSMRCIYFPLHCDDVLRVVRALHSRRTLAAPVQKLAAAAAAGAASLVQQVAAQRIHSSSHMHKVASNEPIRSTFLSCISSASAA